MPSAMRTRAGRHPGSARATLPIGFGLPLGRRARAPPILTCVADAPARHGRASHIEASLDTNRRLAADPDVAADTRDMDAAGSSEHGALVHDVGVRRETGPDQPLSKTGIEAAGDGILAGTGREERPHLKLRIAAIPLL